MITTAAAVKQAMGIIGWGADSDDLSKTPGEIGMDSLDTTSLVIEIEEILGITLEFAEVPLQQPFTVLVADLDAILARHAAGGNGG